MRAGTGSYQQCRWINQVRSLGIGFFSSREFVLLGDGTVMEHDIVARVNRAPRENSYEPFELRYFVFR